MQLACINKLGNCYLLGKSFNISKLTKTLSFFLKDVHEFQKTKDGDAVFSLDQWAEPLLLSPALLNPDTATVPEVVKAIEDRDIAIRSELKSFIRGEKKRVDQMADN